MNGCLSSILWGLLIIFILSIATKAGGFGFFIVIGSIAFFIYKVKNDREQAKIKIIEDARELFYMAIADIEAVELMTAPYFKELGIEPECKNSSFLRQNINADFSNLQTLVAPTYLYYKQIVEFEKEVINIDAIRMQTEKYWIGMSAHYLSISLGEPTKKLIRKTKNKLVESWYYSTQKGSDKFVIIDDKLVEMITHPTDPSDFSKSKVIIFD